MYKNWTTKPIAGVILKNGEHIIFDKPISPNVTTEFVLDVDRIKSVSMRDINDNEYLRVSK